MEYEKVEKMLLEELPSLRSYALYLTGDKHRADDLLHDAVLKILCNPGSFTYNMNFKGWVSTIIHNTYINDEKRASRCVSVCDASVFEGACCVGDVAYMFEIFDGIISLDDARRSVLSLFLTGYKYDEIAERLGVPLGTVKSRLHAARLSLSKRFMA